MKTTTDIQFKKTLTVFVFISLSGIFAGIFFSTYLSEENKEYLSLLIISSISDSSSGYFYALCNSIVSNFILALLMLSSVFFKFLCLIPPAILVCKSFSIGFCSGLIYLSETDNAFITSFFKMLPPSFIMIAGFTALAAAAFIYSHTALFKTKRPSREKKSLQVIVIISLVIIAVGCIISAAVL